MKLVYGLLIVTAVIAVYALAVAAAAPVSIPAEFIGAMALFTAVAALRP